MMHCEISIFYFFLKVTNTVNEMNNKLFSWQFKEKKVGK